MLLGTISSSPDTVGVAVVNYPVPILETKERVISNYHNIAAYIDGVKSRMSF
jgi:amidase